MYVNWLGNMFKGFSEKIKALFLNKNALIFLFFLIAAALFWFVVVLDKVYETRISIPIAYKNIPVDIEIINDIPTHIDVKIKDKGLVLLFYGRKNYFDSLSFDFNRYQFVRNVLSVPATTVFDSHITQRISSSSSIEEYYPRTLDFHRTKLNEKIVPVVLKHTLEFRRQYGLVGDITVSPKEVRIFGSKERLDSIQSVATELLSVKDIKDSIKLELAIEAIPQTRIVPPKVSVIVPVEIFTEATVIVPITVLNLPDNVNVRTIPSEVEIKYQVGKSMFSHISPSDFSITVDYERVVKSATRRHFINIERAPKFVRNVKSNVFEVDCIIVINE